MNATETSAIKRPLLYCLGCDKWHHGNGQYASLPVFIPNEGFKYELCSACEDRAVAKAAEHQRQDIELQLYANRRRQ